MGKLNDYIAGQCGKPHGLIGNLMTWTMNRANRVMYRGIVDCLELRNDTRILDIGFGNGYLESLILKKGQCRIDGIDISEDMVRKAAARNREAVASGKVRFMRGDCCNMEFADGTFDTVVTMNTIYFWENTRQGMAEIHRVLKPGGVFYNAVIAKESLDRLSYTQNGFRKFDADTYRKLGLDAGFSDVGIRTLGNASRLLVICRKASGQERS